MEKRQTSQDWFSDVRARARRCVLLNVCVFRCTLGICKTWVQCRVWAGEKKNAKKTTKNTATRLIKRGLVLFSHLCGCTNCWRICIYSLQPSLVGACTSTRLLLIGGFFCIVSLFFFLNYRAKYTFSTFPLTLSVMISPRHVLCRK